MTTPAQRSARVALDDARPAVARLDSVRGPEDLAADLIDVWSAVEAALRALVGSSTLTGQPLIREARQRQLINFDQANALAEFEAVHLRLQNTSYRPSESDVAAGRSAFLKLESALVDEPAFGGPNPAAPAAAAGIAAPVPAANIVPAAAASTAPPPRGISNALKAVIAVVVVLVLVGIGYAVFGRRGQNGALQQGITAYTQGQREAAESDFNRAAREDPKSPLPHIYLARMAREVGNFPLAAQELQLALQDDPNNELALREMGADLLQQGNYELARRFYVRAVTADPTDKLAQGYLGCTLMRLGRASEGTNFLNRAGPGPWSNCATAAPAGTPIPH